MASKQLSGFASAFDDMLARSRREMDALPRGGLSGRPRHGSERPPRSYPPGERSQAPAPLGIPAGRGLDEKLGPGWLDDVVERTVRNRRGRAVGQVAVTHRQTAFGWEHMHLARPGQGKSGGVRAILVLRQRERAFFLHGFAKSDRGTLLRTEFRAVRALADEMLRLDEADLDAMLANGAINEVTCDGQAVRE